MRFEFDSRKSALNLQRHGVDLEWATQLWDLSHAIIEGKHVSEQRSLLLAMVDGRCWVAVFTKRGDAVRLISCHRADRRLERIYEEEVQRKKRH